MRTALGILMLGSLLIWAGCANIGQEIAAVVAKPILGFAAKDATTTLDWIAAEEKAGRLSQADATLARECPDAVIALDALREKWQTANDTKGTRGLIYLGTVRRWGTDPVSDAKQQVRTIVKSCVELIPDDATLFGLF